MSDEILVTKDYSIFRTMNGNRETGTNRVNELVDSIKKIGWISNPIIVNKKMEIVDGQGRFAALKKLGMPIEYHIVPNAGLTECRMMNNKMKKWTTIDFVSSYANTGNKNYQRVSYLMEYFDVPLDVVMIAKDVKNKYQTGGTEYKKMREGQLEFTENDYINASRILNIYKRYRPIFEKVSGRTRTKDTVILYLISYAEKYGTLDHEKMLDALGKCDPKLLYNLGFDRLLESVQNAYNFNKPKKSRLYFYEEYRLDNRI